MESAVDDGWGCTSVQCVECGRQWASVHPVNADVFALECPNCRQFNSLPVGFEADVINADSFEGWDEFEDELKGWSEDLD